MKALLGLAASMFMLSASAAEIDFKGIALRSTVEQVEQALGKSSVRDCSGERDGKWICLVHGFTYANVVPIEVVLQFFFGRLEGVVMRVRPQDFKQVFDAISTKYGTPSVKGDRFTWPDASGAHIEADEKGPARDCFFFRSVVMVKVIKNVRAKMGE